MGKSIDLPDPLQSASTPLGNADDLLAQLAGEEVDRLLAEADAEGKRPPGPGEARRANDASTDAAPQPTPEPPVQEQLDALFTEINSEESTNRPAVEPAPPARAPSMRPPSVPAVAPIAPMPFAPINSKLPDDIDVNEVMSAILGDGPLASSSALPVSPEPVAAPARPPTAQATMLSAAGVAAPDQLSTTAAERRALALPDPADELPGPGELAGLTAPIEDDRPLPAYLKPLEWMNAPLDLLPPTIRDVLGQVAILTLVNAIAVLIYVFVFRKP